MTKFFPLPIIAVALLAVAPAAVAKGPKAPAANSPLVGALDACRQIPEAEQRLACFDKASAALVGATTSGEVSVVDRGQLRQARKALFGFNMPRLPFFAGDKSADDDKGVLDSTIKSVRSMGYERFQIVLADDAIWETAQVYLSFSEPRKGQKIHIKRGPLGVYFLEIDGQVAIKGRRVG